MSYIQNNSSARANKLTSLCLHHDTRSQSQRELAKPSQANVGGEGSDVNSLTRAARFPCRVLHMLVSLEWLCERQSESYAAKRPVSLPLSTGRESVWRFINRLSFRASNYIYACSTKPVASLHSPPGFHREQWALCEQCGVMTCDPFVNLENESMSKCGIELSHHRSDAHSVITTQSTSELNHITPNGRIACPWKPVASSLVLKLVRGFKKKDWSFKTFTLL